MISHVDQYLQTKDVVNMIANSEGQDLVKHCIAVGIVAGKLAEEITANMSDQETREKIIVQARVAGYLHDIGKADPKWQKFIKRVKHKDLDSELEAEEEDNKAPYHNQVSWYALDGAFYSNYPAAAYAIYFHHCPVRNADIPEDFKVSKDVIDLRDQLLAWHDETHGELPKSCAISSVKNTDKFTTRRPELTIVQICLIQADRWVSRIGKALNDLDLDADATFCSALADFRAAQQNNKVSPNHDLYREQRDAVDEIFKDINEYNTFVIDAPAGSGKTTIALAFCNLFNRKYDIFVAPRNAICTSLYDTIEQDLGRMELVKSRELITACEQQALSDDNPGYLNHDIAIINIDSVLRSYFHHHRTDALIDFLTQPMVIDEFHELAHGGKSAILYLIRNLIASRELLRAKTLLTSATPVNICKGLEVCDKAVKVKQIQLGYPEWLDTEHTFEVVNKFPDELPGNTWMRANTLKALQGVYTGTGGMIVHSKYTAEDRKEKLQLCTEMYSRNGQREKVPVYSSPMLECSLNFSYKDAYLELCSPESLVQSLGRVNRFGEQRESHIALVHDDDLSHANGSYFGKVYNADLASKWRAFVRENIHGKTLRKSDISRLRCEFNEQYKADVEALIDRRVDASRDFTPSVKHQVRRKKVGGDNKSIVDGGLREGGGAFAAFFMKNDSGEVVAKVYALSKQDLDYVRDESDSGGFNRLCGMLPDGGSAFDKFNHAAIRGKKKSEQVFRAARKAHQALPLQWPGKDSFCFEYDTEPDIKLNRGIYKVGQVQQPIIDDED